MQLPEGNDAPGDLVHLQANPKTPARPAFNGEFSTSAARPAWEVQCKYHAVLDPATART